MKPSCCPNCSSIRFTKFGTRNGRQRYRCKASYCGYRFTGETIVKKMDTYFQTKAVQLWLEGMTYVGISNLLGISDDTISKWLQPYVEALEPIRLSGRGFLKNTVLEGNVIVVNKVKGHSSGIIINGFKSQIFGISRMQDPPKQMLTRTKE